MHRIITRPLLLVAFAFAFAVGSATAQAYTIAPAGAITATSNGQITLRSTLWTFSCDWQLTGSIDRASAVVGDQIGTITSTTITRCLGGIVVRDLIATQGSYTITLASVPGSPATGALVRIGNWTFVTSGFTCLYASSNLGLLIAQDSGGTSATTMLANVFSGTCGTASLSGSFTISPGQTIS